MNREVFKWMAKIANISALYVIFTLISYPLSFNIIQFRVSEVLMLLCLFDPKNIIGVTIGCFIANLFSSVNILDIFIGSFATFLSGLLIYLTNYLRIKKIYKQLLASIIPAIINGFVVGGYLSLFLKTPFYLCFLGVFIGEAVVVCLFGNAILLLLEKNNVLKRFI